MKHYTITWERADSEPQGLMVCSKLPARVLVQRLQQATENYGRIIIHKLDEET